MIFIASAEVSPLPGSQMKDRSVGASVYCLIPAESKSAGEAKLRACLEQDKYRLINISGLDLETPLVDRNPFAWILLWPDLIWKRILNEDQAETATYITVVITFSAATFAILRLSNRRRSLW